WWVLALQEAGGAATATAGGLGQAAGRPGLAVRPRLRVSGLQPRPNRAVVSPLGSGGQEDPLPGADGPRRLVVVGGGGAACNRRGLGKVTGRVEGARGVAGGSL